MSNAARHRHEDAVGTSAMLIATTYAQLGDFRQAEKWFDTINGLACHHTIVAECNYFRAVARYLAGDIDGARRLGKLALRPGEDIVYARTRSLFGWIAVAQCDYPCAYTEFLGSLDVLDRCRAEDTHLRANVVSALAITAAEAQLGDPQLLDAETAKVRWNPSLVKHQVQTLRHTGFAYETRGDTKTAMQRYAAAAEVAPDTVWAIYGYAACANLAFRLGQLEAAEAFTFMAGNVERRISATTGWHDIDDEQRISLLELAQISARLGDGTQARRCRDLYYENPELAALSSLHHDFRLSTFKLHVDAMVDAASGKHVAAVASLTHLKEQWSRIGCPRRASEASRDLALIDIHEKEDRQRWPAPVDPPPRLSRREIAIVQFVAAGLSNAEIAEKLHLAPKTVKNRIGQIYIKYGVHNRTKLALRAKGQDSYDDAREQRTKTA